MRILFENAELLAIDKPPGIAVHDAPGPGTSVLRMLREQHGLENLTPVHRLDKDASGVLIFAKSKVVASEITEKWPTAEKTYVALCAGVPAQSEGMVDALILENQTGKPERLKNAVKWFTEHHPAVELPSLPAPKTSGVHPAGRPSQTAYWLLEKFETGGAKGVKYSLLKARPKQGRMHQIRVHLAHVGCPLLLDRLYGTDLEVPKGLGLQRMPLHAAELALRFHEQNLRITAPLPEDIQNAIAALRSL